MHTFGEIDLKSLFWKKPLVLVWVTSVESPSLILKKLLFDQVLTESIMKIILKMFLLSLD